MFISVTGLSVMASFTYGGYYALFAEGIPASLPSEACRPLGYFHIGGRLTQLHPGITATLTQLPRGFAPV